MAAAGRTNSFHPLLTGVSIILVFWYINATCLNDLADEAIDRINLPDGRVLTSGKGTRRELLILGLAAAAASLATAWVINRRVGLVVSGGLVVNLVYSLKPFRISDRGWLAPAILSLGYAALPYLVGAYSVAKGPSKHGWILLAGLYLATTARVLLKDFRDVMGDKMFGRTTFLLRHGARITCFTSAGLGIIGAVILVWVFPLDSPLLPAFGIYLACLLYGLRRLASAAQVSEQVKIVGGISRMARIMTITLLVAYSMIQAGWPAWRQGAVLIALVTAGVWMYATDLATPSSP